MNNRQNTVEVWAQEMSGKHQEFSQDVGHAMVVMAEVDVAIPMETSVTNNFSEMVEALGERDALFARLDQFALDDQYVSEHLNELSRTHGGKFVFVFEGVVLASDRNGHRLICRVKSLGYSPQQSVIRFIPRDPEVLQ